MLALATAVGCRASPLVRDGDPTFAHASERWRRTHRQVMESGAPEDEVAFFLQAEALYRYRFDPPPRGLGTYAAAAAAATLDLPALQALAASLDLFQLRLRAYDGAIQLWETFLAARPRSALRPLVLYRLGWAYRSGITPGMPRDSNDAFDELVARHPSSPLAPLAREALRVPWKSQDAATGWSLVPGLGQMYAGEWGNGTVRLSIALAATALIAVPAILAWGDRDDLTWRDDWPLLASALAGVIILSVDYTLSYEDALRAVMQHNERHEAAFERAHPAAP
jgi:hypothetical protein